MSRRSGTRAHPERHDGGRGRQRARRGEGDLLRDEILESAERLLVESGDENAVSIRAVAEAVGVTPPSIYMHFADKTALLFAICDKHFAQFDSYVEQAAAHASEPLQALALRGRAYVQFGLEHPEQYRILFMRRPSATPAEFQNEGLRRTMFDHHLEAVQRCVDAGVIGGDPLLAAITLWAAVHGITSLLLSKPDFPWPDVDQMLNHVLQTQIYGVAREG
jgi:AcrR family transcriptional regulator